MDWLFLIIIGCQIYGVVKGLTANLALSISIMSGVYGTYLILGGHSTIFAIIWFVIAYFYYKNYSELKI